MTRECLAAVPDTSISGKGVARELTALIDARSKPGMIVSDNGTEFTSNAWITDYNTARPHSSLGYKTPAAYAGTLTALKGVTLAEALIAAG